MRPCVCGCVGVGVGVGGCVWVCVGVWVCVEIICQPKKWVYVEIICHLKKNQNKKVDEVEAELSVFVKKNSKKTDACRNNLPP